MNPARPPAGARLCALDEVPDPGAKGFRFREGDYLFVHAGIRPGIALARQAKDDLLTIRQPFLWTELDLGVVVVHGHSNHPTPVVAKNRIGLDTGAGNGGKLTCAVLEEDRVGFLAA